MQRREVIESEQPVNYALLSLFQYIASVLVILIHCQRLFEHEALHFVQKSMFGRMAVPFFLISSAYFFPSTLEARARFYETDSVYQRHFKGLLLLELGLSSLCFDLFPIIAFAPLPSSAGYSSSALLHRNELPALVYSCLSLRFAAGPFFV